MFPPLIQYTEEYRERIRGGSGVYGGQAAFLGGGQYQTVKALPNMQLEPLAEFQSTSASSLELPDIRKVACEARLEAVTHASR